MMYREKEKERELQLTIEIKTRCSKVSRGTRDCAEFRSGAVLLKAGYRERERERGKGWEGEGKRGTPWERIGVPSVSLLRKDSRVSSKEPRILKSHFSSPSLTTNSATKQRG